MIHIRKRSGQLAKLDITNVTKQTRPACEGLSGVSYEDLELSANISFVDGMLSSDIQEILINTAKSKVEIDAPNWTYVAARLRLYDLYHQTKRNYSSTQSGDVYKAITLSSYLRKNSAVLDFNQDIFDISKLEQVVDGTRDLLFNHLGIETLLLRYLINDNGTPLELPQHMFMGLAMWLAQNEPDPTAWALTFYESMSTLKVVLATPTLSQGRLKNRNHSSCFVGTTPDSIEGILSSYSDFSLGSKEGGGWGNDWTRVRALGGQIRGKRGVAGGLIPWLKIQSDFCIAVDQLGVRKGSETASIENWHLDVFDFIDLRKTSGEERRRADDLFLALSVSDLFMQRVQDEGLWTLFDPADVPELTELHSEAFTAQYIKYEQQLAKDISKFTNPPKQIKAKELWSRMISSYFEVGMPFIFFKDTVNRANPHPELGMIRSSNLCMEIAQSVNEDETVVCNLGSLNYARVADHEIYEQTCILYQMLDNVIDLSAYPTDKARQTQLSRRAIGCGFMGQGEAIANLGIMYGTQAHLDWLDKVMTPFNQALGDMNTKLSMTKGNFPLLSALLLVQHHYMNLYLGISGRRITY